MTVERQAKRILLSIPNFSEGNSEVRPVGLALNNLFGLYRNPFPPYETVWIYEDGLIWQIGGVEKRVRYAEVDKIVLPHDKKSEYLHLLDTEGQLYKLPIRGNDGKFYDSLVFLRFLRKAISIISSGVQ